MRRTKKTRMTRSSIGNPSFRSVFAAVVALACASALPAQQKKSKEDDTSRTVQGTVVDANGKPVAQAAVQLKDSRTLQILSFITKDDGSYHFAGLKTDTEYEVKAEHGEMFADWKRISVFDPRKVVELNLKLDKEKKQE